MTMKHEFAEEAKKLYGHTESYKQSEERVGKMSLEKIAELREAQLALLKKIADVMDLGPDNANVQELIAKHYESLNAFYDPTPHIYAGLAETYVNDRRFAEKYEAMRPGLAQFMHDAMLEFCKKRKA